MKIAWFHSHLLNPNSGGTRYICDYISYLSKHNYKIDLYCDQIDKNSISFFEELGVRLVILDNLSTYSPIYWLTLPIRLYNKRRIFKTVSHEYDLAISSMFPMHAITQNQNLKTIQICFEPYAFFYDNKFLSQFRFSYRIFFKLMSYLYSKIDRHYTKLATKVITISTSSQKKIKEIYQLSSNLIFAGISVTKFKKVKMKDKLNFKKKFKGFPLLVHSTDYSGAKATDQLVDIILKLKKYFPNIKLLVVYYLDDKKIFKQLSDKHNVKDTIMVLKAFPLNYLPVVYSSVDCVIQPNINRNESWPLREGLVAGTPIIGGINSEESDFVTNSLKIDANNVEGSVKKMRSFLNKLERTNNSVITHYELEYNGKKLIKLIKSL